jgi:hypothetical protein
MNDLKEYDIQAPLWDFYGFAQMIVVKTILIMVRQPKIRDKYGGQEFNLICVGKYRKDSNDGVIENIWNRCS